MKPIIPEIVKEVEARFKEDARQKGLMNADLERRLVQHKKFETLRQDWAIKRIGSIFREVERLGVKIEGFKESRSPWVAKYLKATFQNVTLEGEVHYRQMDQVKAFTYWKRPKIEVRFWVLDSKNDRCYLEGHVSEALKIVFGEKRMLTYNRLFAAILNAMAR